MAPRRSPASRVPLQRLPSNDAKQATLTDLFAKQQTSTASSPRSGGLDSVKTNHSLFDDSDSEGEDEREAKRARVDVHNAEDVWTHSRPAASRNLHQHVLPGRVTNAFDLMTRLSLGPATHRNRLRLNKVEYSELLQSYVSNNARDTYRINSLQQEHTFTPPFDVQFTHEAKRGGKQVMAVATEEGSIALIDANEPCANETYTRQMLQPHENAIFHSAFSHDDQHIASASGDQTMVITDVRTGLPVYRSAGHLCTIKKLQWDPSNPSVIATGSRDGSIRIWDIRLNQVAAQNVIRNAHGTKKRRTPADQRSATRSVTAISYLRHTQHQLASASSYDGCIKVWDLRKNTSKRANPPALIVSPDHTRNLVGRTHGICSLTLSSDATQLYAMSTAHHIFSLDAHDLSNDNPLKTFNPGVNNGLFGLTRNEFRTNSFYNNMALSCEQNGRFLAATTVGNGVWLFDTEAPESQPICLTGHERAACSVDFSMQMLASSSDDLTVRTWRPNLSVSRAIKDGRSAYAREGTVRQMLHLQEHWSGHWGARV